MHRGVFELNPEYLGVTLEWGWIPARCNAPSTNRSLKEQTQVGKKLKKNPNSGKKRVVKR